VSDTIYAVSSGAPPAAIAVLRVSGPAARAVATTLAGGVPQARRATLRRLRDAGGETLDHALVLWFPGPATATGEDLLELHLHGGRAVIAAVERAVAVVTGTRRAEPGEFTRRALLNGRIDLAQAAGLADLLEAETESQRRAALSATEGALSREVANWLARLSEVRAQVEAVIDYDEEGDVAAAPDVVDALTALAADLDQRLAAPTSERVREGWRVAIMGPPNAGKSSLFNAMLGRDAAIVAPIAGTTRDLITARVMRDGQLFTLIDTAGLAEATDDPIEREGIRRALEMLGTVDLVLWMGEDAPDRARQTLWLRGRCDEKASDDARDVAVSARLPDTVDCLWERVGAALAGQVASAEGYLLQESQRAVLAGAARQVSAATSVGDPLVRAEHLRAAGSHLAALVGVDHTEAMLDALFARFCVGK
jgi:tRNA modification GTPase